MKFTEIKRSRKQAHLAGNDQIWKPFPTENGDDEEHDNAPNENMEIDNNMDNALNENMENNNDMDNASNE